MSDVNKTIQIQYRAEVQNLVNGLKKVGQVSEKEAKKLVNDWIVTHCLIPFSFGQL